ncbi:AAA family ATPase [Kitasatospora arboriphila]
MLAVNVALATERPLLVRGRPGRGKSSLAPSVAHQLGRRFYRSTISSRTQAQDLLWGVDEVGWLSDASAHEVRSRSHYVVPGVLWWAFDPQTAAHRGLGPAAGDLLPEPNEGADGSGAVVLLDEIDKADPDVPNDLLEPLGSYRFRREDGVIVEAADPPPLVVLTTNEERELPKAFLRRCVVLVLRPPSAERLLEIARAHFGHREDTLFQDVLQSFGALQDDDDAAEGAEDRAEEDGLDVSTAEFLDTIAAAERLSIGPGHPLWPDIVGATARKPTDPDLR